VTIDQVLRSVEISHNPREPLFVAVPPHPHHSSDSLQRQSQSQSCKLERLLQSLTNVFQSGVVMQHSLHSVLQD
jgi:hypothetical protein